MANSFHAGQVCYIPGIGISLAEYGRDRTTRQKMRREFGFGEQDFVVLSVGQLSRRKNQEVVIRALARLAKDKNNVQYVLAGLGEREARYRRLARKLGVAHRVHVAGYRSDIPDLLQMADCFAFPSRQEGLPVALMEAMAAGVAVVCSRIRGNCDLIRDGIEGRLVEPGDDAGFADAIRQVMEHQELADSYRDNARKRVEKFSCQRVNWKMKQIYGQYLGDKSH